MRGSMDSFGQSRDARRTLRCMNDSTPKRLDEMNDLRDMGRFPLPVYAGATGNVLMTILLTYLLRGRFGGAFALPGWASAVISMNLLPVVLLRSGMDKGTRYPVIEEMSFFGDQHKFASWVYAVASANMLVWILLAWSLFAYRRDRKALGGLLLLALVCTSFPAWIRLLRR